MCGFVGNIGEQHMLENIQAACARIAHRGPDDSGFYSTQGFAAGFQRLAIVDVSHLGHQPMQSRDGRYTIVFNGEIYNFIELREELLQLGHTFISSSDTEVILAAFSQWGTGCFQRMNGMWAILIWDSQTATAYLSRDRFGEKPLYWHQMKNNLIVASEIKAFQAFNIPFLPNHQRVVDYLVYGYLDHTDETMYDTIFQVRPGTVLTYKNGSMSSVAYWELQPSQAPIPSFEEAAKQFRELFFDSIRLRLRSDVPIGSCLSGGLDSSSIVAASSLISKHDRTQLRHETFTAFSSDPKNDERRFSRLIEQQYKISGHEIEPRASEFLQSFPRLLAQQDEPFLSMSMYAQARVMESVHQQGITVILDGQGGDEILAGYMTYFGSYMADLLRQGRWWTAWSEWKKIRAKQPKSMADILPSLALYLLPERVMSFVISRSSRTEIIALHPHIKQKYFHPPQLPRPFRSQLQNHLFRLLTGPGLRALLHSEDRNAMAASVESRVPFLDHRLAEFTLRLPGHYLLGGGTAKRLLRAALGDILPSEIRDRTDKMGFVVSQPEWMRGELRAAFQTTLLGESLRIHDYVQPAAVKSITSDFLSKKNNETALVWRFFCLEHWLRSHSSH